MCAYLHCTVCFFTTGGPKDQGTDDGVRDYDGGLPATRRQGQLLPHGHLQPRCYQVRHRLPDRGDRATGERLVRAPPKPPFSSLKHRSFPTLESLELGFTSLLSHKDIFLLTGFWQCTTNNMPCVSLLCLFCL